MDIQTSITNEVTLHLKFDRRLINESFIYDLYDRQFTTVYVSNYKFDIKHSLGSFYGCIIKKLDTYQNNIELEIISDHNNAKPLKEHRSEFIKNILSTHEDENSIKNNNNANKIK